MKTALLPQGNSTGLWLKLIAVFGVIWYIGGLVQFWLGYTMDTTAAVASGAITSGHGAAIDQTPAPIWLSFALASATGLIGSVLLFKGSSAAKTVFAISVISALIYFYWILGISETSAARPSEDGIVAVVVSAITIGFFLLSRRVT